MALPFQVGERAWTRQKGHKCTLTLQVNNMTFRSKSGHIIHNTAPLEKPMTATECTTKIEKSKSGKKNQCVTQECTGTQDNPVKSWA